MATQIQGAKIVTEEIENAAGANPYSISLSAEQTASSGTVTTVDFTSIPAGTKHITIMLVGISTDGTNDLIIQLGDATGGVETSGYTARECAAGGSATPTADTSGFILDNQLAAAGAADAVINLYLEDSTNHTWVSMGILQSTNASQVSVSAGAKTLSHALDRVRVTTVATADDFDGGVAAIQFQ
tara:strand:- start:201 stop:755 length:555 start_codon:yes stop_codon:yes gene_type:complete